MQITCQNLMHLLGWRCRELPEHGAIYISTPARLPGGTPLDFYLTQHDGYVHLSDDGLTLFHLRGLGYALDDGRSQRSIASIAEAVGLELDDSGAIVGAARPEQISALGQKIQFLTSKIVEWELEHFAASDSNLSLADEVERLMKGKAPHLPIVQAPTLKLSSGDEVSFTFRWGDKFVDAVPPVTQATSARMRKAIQVMRDLEADWDTLYIVDDRLKPGLAEHEVGLLGQVAPAVRLSDFDRHYEVAA